MGKKRFSAGKTMVIGLGFLGINLVWPVFNSFVPLFLQAGNPEFEQQLLAAGREIPSIAGFGLSPSLAFFIMTWDNIFNVIINPWVGLESDRRWTRFGRRKPWILIGTPIAAIALSMIPLANTVFAIMVFIVTTNFGMALFRAPTVAWLGDLFPKKERSKANGIINLMGGVGGAMGLVGSGMLFDNFGRFAPFLGAALLLLISEGIAVWQVKEPHKETKNLETTKSQNILNDLISIIKSQSRNMLFMLMSIFFYFMAYEALQTGLTSFGVFTLGITPGLATTMTAIFAGSFILFAVPSGFISSKLGRKNTMLIGIIAMIVLFSSGFFLIKTPLVLGIVLVLTGIAWAFVNVNSLPLVFDLGGKELMGVYTGLYYVAAQGAAVAGPVLSGVVVDLMGNDYRWLWAVSGIHVLFALFAIWKVNPSEAKNNG